MTEIQPVNWQNLSNVYKTCLISRLCNFNRSGSASVRLHDFQDIELAEAIANPIGSVVERVLNSSSEKNASQLPESNGEINVIHPISGEERSIPACSFEKEALESAISELTKSTDPKVNFFTLWQLWPEQIGEMARSIPSSLAVPDIPLINHIDMTSGIWVSRQQGEDGGAYLSFAFSPVQSFIELARSVRDLWTGSTILSWLTFKAMEPIIQNFGPTAIVFPNLRGNPQMNRWLFDNFGLNSEKQFAAEFNRCLSIPNKFVALVPAGENGKVATDLAEECEEAVNSAWAELSYEVHNKLHPIFEKHCKEWDRLWKNQTKQVFDFQTCVIPVKELHDDKLASLISTEDQFADAWPDLAETRGIFESIAEELIEQNAYESTSKLINEIGRWQIHMDYSERIMGAIRSVRHIPVNEHVEDSNGYVPFKCSVYGTWEQMGPAESVESREFWTNVVNAFQNNDIMNGVRIRQGEQFCSISLIKRFAEPVFFSKELKLREENKILSRDTATVAAENWLEDAKIYPHDERRNNKNGWSGHWLHNLGIDEDDPVKNPKSDKLVNKIKEARELNGRPPTYYAILLMDGDKLHERLIGNIGPQIQDILPSIIWDKLNSQSVFELNDKLRRPLCPSLHAAISSVLSHFSTQLVPKIVEECKGTLIYSGGDDLLALLPAANALECAMKLHNAFKTGKSEIEEKHRVGGMGTDENATMSAGIVYVHFKEDLRNALKTVRNVEKIAKNSGRNIVNMYFMKRSGVHSSALIPWSRVDWFNQLSKIFKDGASKRWTYSLCSDAMLDCIGEEAEGPLTSEIKRIGNRVEDVSWRKFVKNSNIDANQISKVSLGEIISEWWLRYYEDFVNRKNNGDHEPSVKSLFKSFALLCQGAAFVVRAFDEED